MVVAELLTRLGFQVDPREMNRGLHQARSALLEFKSFAGKLMLGYGIAEIGKAAIQSGAQLETMRVQLETMTQHSGKAGGIFKGVVDYAKQTNFYMKDALGATLKLMQGQMPTVELIPKLRQLGDIANDSPALQRLAMAYSRTFQRGYMSGQELKRFQEGGNFNPLQILAMKYTEAAGLMKKGDEILAGSEADKYMRAKQGELLGMVKNHGVTVQMVDEAIQYATSKGGIFFEHQKDQVRTFQGAFSNMLDVITINAGLAVQKLFPLFKSIMDTITNMPFDKFSDWLQAFVNGLQYLWKVLVENGLLVAFGDLSEQWMKLVAAFGGSGVILKGLVYLFAKLTVLTIEVASAVLQLTAWLTQHRLVLVALLGLLAYRFIPTMIASSGVVKTLGARFRTATGYLTSMKWAVMETGSALKFMFGQMAAKNWAGALVGLQNFRAGLNMLGEAMMPTLVLAASWAIEKIFQAIDAYQEMRATENDAAKFAEYTDKETKVKERRIHNQAAYEKAKKENDIEGMDKYSRILAGNDKELTDLRAQYGMGAKLAGRTSPEQEVAEYMSQMAKSSDEMAELLRKHLPGIEKNTSKSGVPNDVLRLGDMAFRTHLDVVAGSILLGAE